MITSSLAALAGALASAVTGPAVLDADRQFKAQTFWDNRDWDWYRASIPLFECPDADITTTYYYRWELVTKHLVYGSPEDGYAFTEFIDRPFWSGTYGAISCPAGHQLYEVRWLKNPRFARDYSRYWFRVPGAQPRRYGCWLVDGIHAVSLVHPDAAFYRDLLPDIKANFEGWEKRQFVPDVGLFWQNGHDDGMEFNINSRQTQDILRGANGYRPGFNAYMFADARAIAAFAREAGDTATADSYDRKAAALRKAVLEKLWDPKRGFFFPMSMRDEQDKEGNVVKALTLTYQSGKFAGSEHGRELHGYIPWQFGMAEAPNTPAWKFLMQRDYFAADFGPTTVERNDPMFLLQKSCCWWSGQSWPYATAQTLTALANLLNGPTQAVITREDYLSLLQTYARTHRKNGRPYLAEACHPDTGSWEGHDAMGHSNHYFHSSYCDQIVTGLVGLRPRADDTVEVNPLAPDTWEWWALDDVPYHGHRLSILWDKSGNRYGKGKGLHVLAEGKPVAHSVELKKLTAALPAVAPPVRPRRANWAVNNAGSYHPMATASSTAHGAPSKAVDGNYWYHVEPPNRWIAATNTAEKPWFAVDFGLPRKFDSVFLYLLDDAGAGPAAAPAKVSLEYWKDGIWAPIPDLLPPVDGLRGHTANRFTFPTVEAARVRVIFDFALGQGAPGLTEIEVWGDASEKILPPPPPPPSLARTAKVTASFTSPYDKVEEANDGKVGFNVEPRNRWTCYGSPSDRDWLTFDFGKPTAFRRVDVMLFDDNGGVRRPDAMSVQIPDGQGWKDVAGQTFDPPRPAGGQKNAIAFPEVTAGQVRVQFTHHGKARSGVTEVEIWNEQPLVGQ